MSKPGSEHRDCVVFHLVVCNQWHLARDNEASGRLFSSTRVLFWWKHQKKKPENPLNFVMIKQSPAVRTSKGNPAVLNVNDRHWLQGDFSNREPAHLKKHLSVHIKHVPLWRNQLIIILLLAFIFFYSLPCRKAAYKYSNRLRDVLPLRD